MLVTIDKRGSVSLPSAFRKEFGLLPGTYLDLTVQNGGTIVLNPVAVYPTVRLAPEGLLKLSEARSSGSGELPDWLREEMADATTDSQ